MFLVSSSVKVSIFHITWMDNFWTDLVYTYPITTCLLCSTSSCTFTLDFNKIKTYLCGLQDCTWLIWSGPCLLLWCHFIPVSALVTAQVPNWYSSYTMKSGSCLSQCPYIFYFLCLKLFALNPYKAFFLIVPVRIWNYLLDLSVIIVILPHQNIVP